MANLDLAERYRVEWAVRVIADIVIAECIDTCLSSSHTLEILTEPGWMRVRETIDGKLKRRTIEEREIALDILAEIDYLDGIL